MAVTSLTITRTGRNSVRLAFTSDRRSDLPDPTYYIWRNGILVARTTQTFWDAVVPQGWFPVFDVFDSASDMPAKAYRDFLVLQWRGGGSAVAIYRVQEYLSGSWVTKAQIPEDGYGYYRWRTRRLEDETTHQFRIVGVGADGNMSTAASFSVLMVRYPDPPAVGMAYSNTTHKVTVSAA